MISLLKNHMVFFFSLHVPFILFQIFFLLKEKKKNL